MEQEGYVEQEQDVMYPGLPHQGAKKVTTAPEQSPPSLVGSPPLQEEQLVEQDSYVEQRQEGTYPGLLQQGAMMVTTPDQSPPTLAGTTADEQSPPALVGNNEDDPQPSKDD